MSIFLQLIDVLLGCVQFDWNDQQHFYAVTSYRAQTKWYLTAFVKSRFGLTQRDAFLVTPASRFRQWTKPSRFSVWKWKRS
jgi:hypothetical protein